MLYDQVQVEGHTDDLPFRRAAYPRDNWELSTARTTAVMRFLTHGPSRCRAGGPVSRAGAETLADETEVRRHAPGLLAARDASL